MEPGGCELRLRLGADRRRDTCAEVIGTFPSAMKQRGDADARLATNHQGRASLPEIIENGIERQSLGGARRRAPNPAPTRLTRS
jgi:hypothetical protein